MRDRCDVTNEADLEANGIDGPHGGLTSGTGAFDQNADTAHAVFLRFARSDFSSLLGGERSALAGPFKTGSSTARPAHDIPVHIGEGDNRVIEGRADMGDPGRDILLLFLFTTSLRSSHESILREIISFSFRRLSGAVLSESERWYAYAARVPEEIFCA